MANRKGYLILLSICIIIFSMWMVLRSPDSKQTSEEDRAVIVDGLVSFSNPEFIDEAVALLSDVGFEVEVIEPDEVTVDFYKNLPTKGYDLIILRVHCGPLRRASASGSYIPEGTVFFTTELYSPDKYKNLQTKGLLAVANIRGDKENRYFAVPPWFFEDLDGNFLNATVVLDSCYGFWKDAPYIMSETLKQKGVRIFIGWNGEVQADHSDTAVLSLIGNLYGENLTVAESVNTVMEEVGPDPFYKSELLYYPVDSGDLILKK